MGKHTINKHIKLPAAPSKGPSLFSIIVCFAIAAPLGMIMSFFRLRSEWRRKQHSDYNTYANIIGSRITVNLSEISSKSGKPIATVISDLQAMIDKGYIGKGAYIDRKNMVLVLDPSFVETTFVYEPFSSEPEAWTYEGPVYETVFTEPKKPEPEPPKAEEPPKERPAVNKTPVYNFTGNEEYAEKLRQIRDLDLAIDNEAVSASIDRIGYLSASIFNVVQEHPERADEVRKFMNYYLPTTFKLLKSYSLMEKQSYQGENIVASRKKIENILDSLVHAFEQQLDRLFHAEAMDVDTDISVLETMMTSDGLIQPEITLRTAAGKKKDS